MAEISQKKTALTHKKGIIGQPRKSAKGNQGNFSREAARKIGKGLPLWSALAKFLVRYAHACVFRVHSVGTCLSRTLPVVVGQFQRRDWFHGLNGALYGRHRQNRLACLLFCHRLLRSIFAGLTAARAIVDIIVHFRFDCCPEHGCYEKELLSHQRVRY